MVAAEERQSAGACERADESQRKIAARLVVKFVSSTFRISHSAMTLSLDDGALPVEVPHDMTVVTFREPAIGRTLSTVKHESYTAALSRLFPDEKPSRRVEPSKQ
jgi:hypothetical protein